MQRKMIHPPTGHLLITRHGWERIKQDVDQRAAALRAKAAQHQAQEAMLRAQLAHHIRSARVYQTLADLEHEKFRLFALTLEKLHEASRYCQELDLSTETQLLETLEQTYCQLYDSLPEDEKI